jgi:hypothetical protein
MVGYCEDSKAYRLIDPRNPCKVQRERNVRFIEDHRCITRDQELTFLEEQQENTENNIHINAVDQMSEPQTTTVKIDSIEDNVNLEGKDSNDEVNTQAETNNEVFTERRYPLRDRKAQKFPGYVSYFSSVDNSNDLLTTREAMSRMDSDKWQEAMQAELQSLHEYGAWSIAEKPEKAKVISCKWVFKLKTEIYGIPDHYKARLVAKGFAQTYGENYDETFAPVVHKEIIRMLFGFAAEFNLRVEHSDVKTAFLNGKLKETVYMQLPETFECENAKNKVILLHKVLYVLKQASRTWNETVHDTPVQLSLKQLDYEPCVYFKRGKGDLMIIALYVDDFLVMSNSKKISVNLKRELMIKFKMEDLGDVKLCLGIRIQRDKSKSMYALDQTHYIKELVNKFTVENAKSIRTPTEVNLNLQRNDSNELPNVPYQSLIGSLMYVAMHTTRCGVCCELFK